MKTSWVPWGAVIALILLFFLLVINGTISFDGPDVSFSGNDIRPPNIRNFRVNNVPEGDVIAVIDSVVLLPDQPIDAERVANENIIRFSANITDENRIDLVELTLYRLLPQPFEPTFYTTFVLEPPYRFDWDASEAPNGLYGVQVRVMDMHQNEALVYPDVQIALLRFGDLSSQVSPTAPSVVITQTSSPTTQLGPQTQSLTQTPQNQTPQPQAGQPQAGQPQAGQPQAGQPSTTPQSGTLQPQAGQFTDATATRDIRRRDLVFTVLATIFFAVLVPAGRLFASKWSQDQSQDYASMR